jgi:hypothetical protein
LGTGYFVVNKECNMLRQPAIHPARVFHAALIAVLTFAVTLLSYLPLTLTLLHRLLH